METTNMLGTVEQANGNPSDDPLTGAFVPGQVAHASIVGGTGATDPLIGATLGGLPQELSIATGITSSIASKMYEEALLRTLAFTSTTARGTVLDTIRFDPFSASCVNPAAVLYGSVHSQFTGSVFVSIETVANSSLMGRLAIAYIPSMYPEDLIVTPENIFLFDHSIMDVCASGKGTFEMRPTTTSSFVVQRDDGKYYGRLVIIAFTDIANAYGTTMNIPLNLYSRLSPDAHYAGMSLAVLPSTTDSAQMRGVAPVFPRTRNATLITEAQEPVRQEVFAHNIGTNARSNRRNENHNAFTVVTEYEKFKVSQYYGAVKRDPVVLTKEQENERYAARPFTSEGDSGDGFVLDEHFKDTNRHTSTFSSIKYDANEAKYTLPYYQLIPGDFDVAMAHDGLYYTDGYTHNDLGKFMEVAYHRYVSNEVFVSVDMPFAFYFAAEGGDDPTAYTPKDLLCSSGRINSGVAAPLGYRAVRLVDSGDSIPAVKPGLVGETMCYGSEMTEFMLSCLNYFKENTAIKSLTYSVNYTNGDLIADILVNEYGMWMASNNVPSYGMFLGELSFTQTQVVRNTTVWTKLRVVTPTYWSTRENTAAGARRNGNKIVRHLGAEMLASIAAGAVQGIGQGAGEAINRKWTSKMQDDRQAHARNMLRTTYGLKNWLAQKEYDRNFAKNEQLIQTTQSRQVRPPDSSEEAAEQAGPNESFAREVSSRPALYGSLNTAGGLAAMRAVPETVPRLYGGMRQPSAFDGAWDRQAALESARMLAAGKPPGNLPIDRTIPTHPVAPPRKTRKPLAVPAGASKDTWKNVNVSTAKPGKPKSKMASTMPTTYSRATARNPELEAFMDSLAEETPDATGLTPRPAPAAFTRQAPVKRIPRNIADSDKTTQEREKVMDAQHAVDMHDSDLAHNDQPEPLQQNWPSIRKGQHPAPVPTPTWGP